MSQCKEILSYLESGNRLTNADAVRLWGCYRLSGRIKDLRDMGYDIRCDIEANKGKHGYHGVYWMEVE